MYTVLYCTAYESVSRRTVAGDLNKSIDRTLFGKLNVALDDFIDMKEEGEEEEEETKEVEVTYLSRYTYCSFLFSHTHIISYFFLSIILPISFLLSLSMEFILLFNSLFRSQMMLIFPVSMCGLLISIQPPFSIKNR